MKFVTKDIQERPNKAQSDLDPLRFSISDNTIDEDTGNILARPTVQLADEGRVTSLQIGSFVDPMFELVGGDVMADSPSAVTTSIGTRLPTSYILSSDATFSELCPDNCTTQRQQHCSCNLTGQRSSCRETQNPGGRRTVKEQAE